MLKSMTGYGRCQKTIDDIGITVEMKSVNHRYLETNVRLPRKYSLLEEKVKSIIKQLFSRGRIEVWIDIGGVETSEVEVKVDKELAINYHASLKELAELAGISSEVSAYELSKLEGVIVLEEKMADLEYLWEIIQDPFEKALNQLISMREQEGAQLKKDLENRYLAVGELVKEIEKKSPEAVEAYREKLTNRIKEIADGNNELDSNRIMTEAAIFAEKSDITEEIVRMRSHLEQMKKSMESGGPTGRKMDFILQEMNREINTISSKSADALISSKVVEVKSEIEKMREQIQNVE